MRTSSLERLFFTSAVFIVRTDSKVSFSLRRICTSFLWLLSSLEMFLICVWMVGWVLLRSEVFPWGRRGWSQSCCRCRSWIKVKLYLIDNQQMPFELGAKKAGLSLVRAFLHSVEGVRPYECTYVVLSPRKWSSATQLTTNSRTIVMERSFLPEVLLV